MDISRLNDTELKALGYELIERVETTQHDLALVNTEIKRRRAAFGGRVLSEIKQELGIERPSEDQK